MFVCGQTIRLFGNDLFYFVIHRLVKRFFILILIYRSALKQGQKLHLQPSSKISLQHKRAFKLVTKQKAGNLHQWSLTSLAQNRPTIHQQFYVPVNEVKQPGCKVCDRSKPFAKFSMTSNFGCFALVCVRCKGTFNPNNFSNKRSIFLLLDEIC